MSSGATHELPRRAALLLLEAYRIALSPWIGPACRFEPSCSRYASEAIERHGLGRGSWLAARRVSRCHPLGGSGYDPVPGGRSPDRPHGL